MERWGIDAAEHHAAAATALDHAFDDLREEEANPTLTGAVWLRAHFTDGDALGVNIDGDGEVALLDEVARRCFDLDGSNVEHVALTTKGLAMLRSDAADEFVTAGGADAPDDVETLGREPHRAMIVVVVTRLSAVVLVVPYTHIEHDGDGGGILSMPNGLPMLDVDGIAASPTYRRAVLALVEAFDVDVRSAAKARLDA